jgi:single-strand DNA-binding protein
MDAQITLAGYAGSDVEVYQGDGWRRAHFRFAHKPLFRGRNGWVSGETLWFEVSCGSRLAEHTLASVHNGDALIVVGRPRVRSWIDEHQQKHEMLSIDATCVGHDLNRGTSVFTKAEKPVLAPAPPPDDDPLGGDQDSPDLEPEPIVAQVSEPESAKPQKPKVQKEKIAEPLAA